ncbi:MAG: 3-dehydroquinate synthase [Phycisphaerae bacterium]|jgi:3-dehydroquinate synthase|nr:MAG: 3-dehydroquinate synthase [Phycisphaerae bacterium]
MTHTVHVGVAESPYDVTIEPGLMDRIGTMIAPLVRSDKVGIVTDSNIEKLYLDRVVRSIQDCGLDPVVATIPAGEAYKTLSQLLPVYDIFLRARFERTTPILACGGGVVGDMTGFVAATLLRGVPFIQIPTTLLAMVDASVGGKTGVDHPVGKNLIGAFHQPTAVLIDPAVLQTLPPRELRSGLAECIKHEIIRDERGFESLEQNLHRALQLDLDYLSELIAHNVGIKASVVVNDPLERGERAHLNFGHTFGHAIESVSNYAYAHGEAVALGMCAATYAAVELGMINQSDRQRIIRLIQQTGLPTSGLTLSVDSVVKSMYSDKKVRSGRIRFVLPTRIGAVTLRDDLSSELVRKSLESLC